MKIRVSLKGGLIKEKKRKSLFRLRTQFNKNKNLFRFLDFGSYLALYLPYIFLSYIYDGRRNSFLGLFIYLNGILSYRLGTDNLTLFTFFDFKNETKFKDGYLLPVEKIKGGTFIHSIPFFNRGQGKLSRAAGTYSQLLRNDFHKNICYVRIRRQIIKILNFKNLVTLGRVCNKLFSDYFLGKAGRMILKGKKPIVRGIAMNPVDHPNGGRTPGGKVYRSYTNCIARSQRKTRKRNKRLNYFITFQN
jgi:large subunit ribosomal protein L2